MNKKSAILIVGAMCFGAFLFGGVTSFVLNAQNDSPTAPSSFSYPTFSFLKNLKIGDNSQDVRQLQIILNSDQDTRVLGSGIGSKGQESTYFGQLTVSAVMRFQNKYRKEVLEPYNIYTPTGFVGVATRKKLNQVISTIVTAPVSVLNPISVNASSSLATTSLVSGTSIVSGPMALSKEPMPRLYTIRPQQIKKGDTFTLVGAGFQLENTIHIGSSVFAHVLPQDSYNISFTIPATSTIQNGTYEVWVENNQGVSKVSGQPINLTITDSPRSIPVISSVLPTIVASTEMVSVVGTGFTSSGNDIVSGFGTIKNISSNGTQLSFSPRSLISSDVIGRITVGRTIKVDFYVINANGVSNVFGSVNLKL